MAEAAELKTASEMSGQEPAAVVATEAANLPGPVIQNLPAAVTPMGMIEKALSTGASPDVLEKMLALQERWEANEARKAFSAAMALARPKFAPIVKRKDGYDKRYKYETLTDIADAIDGPLAEHGFTYDWITEEKPDGFIQVTCVVTHEMGHSKKNSLSGHPKDSADPKANMNGIQRIGTTVTYLQRYTLKAALGLAADKDTDGAVGPELDLPITADQFQELNELLEQTGETEERLLKFVNGTKMEELTLKQYAKAKAALVQKAKAKKEAA